MKVSIYDVASLAGVSISTVSRVLNKSGYVSSKTEQKVHDAVKKLNFIPSVTAQNLANNETKLIGVYFSSFPDSREISSGTYFLEFIKGVNEVLIRYGYHLLLINEINESEQIMSNQSRPQYYSFIKQKRIDGLILGSTLVHCSSFYELLNLKMPMVYIGEKLLNTTGLNVYAQYKQYTKDILEYFYNRNHRNITILSLEKDKIGSVIREFELEKENKELKVNYFYDNGSLDSYLTLLRKIFTKENRPTALLVQDLSKVQQTINLLNNMNLEVPGDVSIVTVEHKYQDGEQCFPAVTSVYVPAFQMGVEAASMLFEYLHESQDFCKEMIVDSKITERHSVKTMGEE